jgi:acyl-coenzyme A synthetase/AMP-(fatty) acid ligase
LEKVLEELEFIKDAAVVGVYVEKEATEYPVAYVVLNRNTSPSDKLKEKIKSRVASRVAEYKKLRGVYFIDQIPRNPSGNILRRELLKDLKNKMKTESPFHNTEQRNCMKRKYDD